MVACLLAVEDRSREEEHAIVGECVVHVAKDPKTCRRRHVLEDFEIDRNVEGAELLEFVLLRRIEAVVILDPTVVVDAIDLVHVHAHVPRGHA